MPFQHRLFPNTGYKLLIVQPRDTGVRFNGVIFAAQAGIHPYTLLFIIYGGIGQGHNRGSRAGHNGDLTIGDAGLHDADLRVGAANDKHGIICHTKHFFVLGQNRDCITCITQLGQYAHVDVVDFAKRRRPAVVMNVIKLGFAGLRRLAENLTGKDLPDPFAEARDLIDSAVQLRTLFTQAI